MPSRHEVTGAIAVVLSIVACGGASAPSSSSSSSAAATSAGDEEECANLLASASADVSRVVVASQACAVHADCIYIDLTTACRDACVGAVAAGGEAAVDAVKKEVDRKQCAAFRERGCKKGPIPPCVPPLPPECHEGRCV